MYFLDDPVGETKVEKCWLFRDFNFALLSELGTFTFQFR